MFLDSSSKLGYCVKCYWNELTSLQLWFRSPGESWRNWPRGACRPNAALAAKLPASATTSMITRALVVEYGLVAFALVPHMIFLVDYVVRALGHGIDVGAAYWVLYGLGAVVGPLLVGHLADRAGFGPGLRLAYLLIALAVVAPALSSTTPVLIFSSVLIGGFTPGIVPLVLGRVHELVPYDEASQRTVWARATTFFAIGQATGAYLLSYLLVHGTITHPALFIIGAGAAALALVVNLATALVRPERRHPEPNVRRPNLLINGMDENRSGVDQ